jgi:thiol:disulfide interchange protein DsbD
MRRRLAPLLLGLLWAAPAMALARAPVPDTAHGSAVVYEGEPRVEARLLVDAGVVRPGEPVRMGVLFELDRGWHVYWRNPGDSGLPTELDWQVPDATVGPIAWPAPQVFAEQDGLLTTYGYADRVLLSSAVRFEPGASGERRVRVVADFLACEVQCVPGRIELERTVTLGTAATPPDRETRRAFERSLASVPAAPDSLDLELDTLYSQSAVRPGDEFRGAIAVLCRAPEGARCDTRGPRDPGEAFVPDRTAGLKLTPTGTRPHPFVDDAFLVTFEGRATSDDPGTDQRLRGVVQVAPGRWVEADLALPRARAGAEVPRVESPWLEPTARPGERTGVGLWEAVLLALAGGLILNLMPCVLPVLAIKVFGITELAHRSRGEVLASGFAYTAGVVVTMLALAAVVVALRQAGTAVGWGFQFQEPLFIAAISAVLLVFALNLFGVFEITPDVSRLGRIGESATGTRRSFLEGLLAVVLATPCSAPFLGTAVGFAFASSAPVIFGLFFAIGLGLASPYLLVTLHPAWSRFLPRPGAWMVHLRQVLGFALVATIVWLLWVFGQSVGVDGMTGLIGFLVLIGFGTWVFGVLQFAQRRAWALGSGAAIAALAVLGLLAVPLEPEANAPANGAAASGDWRTFEPAAIRSELDSGRPVFVYFTADWCLTCKLNERVVLHDALVRAELERLDVATFKADWTRRDEAIRQELARHGRAGVPMYLVYSPQAPARPAVLPELLTVDGVLDALRRAAPGNAEQS